MKTDTEIKIKGFEILNKHLGNIETERFIALIQRNKFDYSLWRKDLLEEPSLEDISRDAMTYRTRK